MLPFSTLPNHVSSSILEQFEKTSEQHLLACNVETKTRRMMKCFADITGTLPLPDSSMCSVWNLLPNETTNKMSIPLDAHTVCLCRLPPTQMDTAFAVVDEHSPRRPRTRSDDIGWELIYETSFFSTSDITTFEATFGTPMTDDVRSNPTSEVCPPRVDEKGSIKTKSAESMLPHSNEDYSCTSDAESGIFIKDEPPIFARAFEEIVNDKLEEMRVRGSDFVVQSLLATGAQSVRLAPIVSTVVRTMIHRIMKDSAAQAKSFEKALRVGALEVFRRHWKLHGDWRHICSTSVQHSAPTLLGVHKAGLMGSLYRAKVVTAEDITLCLSMLLDEVHLDRLCAMHAMLLHADDRLCKTRNLAAFKRFKERLFLIDPITHMYIWAPAPHAHAQALLQDISDTIEGWMAVQANKRERYHESYLSRKEAPVNAVGPRLRQGRVRD